MPFNSIVSKNIKHIYSGFPTTVQMRHSNPYPTQDQMRLREDNQDLKTGVLRFSEYDETYGCYIPRAPAFKPMSNDDMTEMIQRLQKPTIASQRICNTSEKSLVNELDKFNPRYRGVHRAEDGELAGINERLTRPTKISSIRKHQTATKLTEVSV